VAPYPGGGHPVPRRTGTSPAVLAFLLAAVSAGVGASVLVGSSPAVAPTSAPSFFLAISPLLLVLVVLVLPAVVFGVILLGQLSASGVPLLKPLLTMAIVGLVLAAGYVSLSGHSGALAVLLGGSDTAAGGSGSGSVTGGCIIECSHNGTNNGSGGNSGGSNATGGGQNGTGNGSGGSHNGTGGSSGGGKGGGNTSGGGGVGPGNSSKGPATTRTSAAWQLPPWASLLAPGLLAVPIVLLVVPALRNRARRGPAGRRDDLAARAAAQMQAALRDAAARLERAADPREVVIGLYLRLLGEVAPQMGDVGPRTAGEIRDGHLIRLGVRRETADQLTRLFEEARYSSHPIDLTMTQRAREAIRVAEADILARGPHR
jgi:hypothetical protein